MRTTDARPRAPRAAPLSSTQRQPAGLPARRARFAAAGRPQKKCPRGGRTSAAAGRTPGARVHASRLQRGAARWPWAHADPAPASERHPLRARTQGPRAHTHGGPARAKSDSGGCLARTRAARSQRPGCRVAAVRCSLRPPHTSSVVPSFGLPLRFSRILTNVVPEPVRKFVGSLVSLKQRSRRGQGDRERCVVACGEVCSAGCALSARVQGTVRPRRRHRRPEALWTARSSAWRPPAPLRAPERRAAASARAPRETAPVRGTARGARARAAHTPRRDQP